MNKRFVVALTALAVLGNAFAHGDEPVERLERVLLQKAPEVITFLKNKDKFQPRPQEGKSYLLHVGVLKFAVQKAGASTPDNVGTLNNSLANRLETALILALRRSDKIGILERPSSLVAEKSQRANHEWPDGRAALFDVKEFQLAWGNAEETKGLAADVFLTGTAKLNSDQRSLEVTIQAFDWKKPMADPITVTSFKAAIDPRILMETNESYLVSRGFTEEVVNPQESLKDIFDSREEIKKNPQKHPSQAGNSPVTMSIFYDKVEQKITVTPDGRAEVPEPKEHEDPKKGTKVKFLLHNTSQTDRYGVVLLVNGKNTIFEQELPAERCRKWILEPGKTVEISGFQKTLGDQSDFEVWPAKKAVQTFRYGDFFGTFQMFVFQENKSKPKDQPELTEEQKKEQSVGVAPKEADPKNKSENLEEKKAAIKDSVQKAKISGGRGVLVGGTQSKREVTEEPFESYNLPVMSSVIYYYKTGAGK